MKNSLRYIWAAPCTLLGLLLGLLFLLAGGRVRTVAGVLEFSLCRQRPAPEFAIRAITFGHVVLGLNDALLHALRTHEHAHVRQYERWGLLFFLAYPAASLWQALRGRPAYWQNPFEVQARRAERRESKRHLR